MHLGYVQLQLFACYVQIPECIAHYLLNDVIKIIVCTQASLDSRQEHPQRIIH